jgi:hypothetical protein
MFGLNSFICIIDVRILPKTENKDQTDRFIAFAILFS